jgi:DNA-binding NtrC family response regulator
MNVLIIDDEPGLRSGLGKLLALRDYRVLEAAGSAEARAVISRKEVHIILLDLKLGQENGLALLRELSSAEPGIPVIIITGHGDVASAVDCMKAGAANYIQKPIDHELLVSILDKEKLAMNNRRDTTAFKQSFESVANLRMTKSSHADMKKIEDVIEKVKDSDVTVLLLGETGTGKEVVAKTIHYSGDYRDRPFVGLNCASLNENLLESELFGHERGAFSGAVARKIGRFELAGNGTLFLDEIGDMSFAMQAKLLRVLQEKTMERVGGTRPVSVYCRLIAATNKDLTVLMESGAFREDLFYRLSTVAMKLPPLRERVHDIPDLVQSFMDEANANYGRTVREISPAVMQKLMAYSWPGNIRQLKNVIINATILSDTGQITFIDLPNGKGEERDEILLEGSLSLTVQKYSMGLERRIIAGALEKNGGNISQTALELGVSRKTLYSKMKQLAIKSVTSPKH